MLNEVIEAFLDPLEAIFIHVSVAKVNESSRSGYVLPQRGHREAQRFLELGLRPK